MLRAENQRLNILRLLARSSLLIFLNAQSNEQRSQWKAHLSRNTFRGKSFVVRKALKAAANKQLLNLDYRNQNLPKIIETNRRREEFFLRFS